MYEVKSPSGQVYKLRKVSYKGLREANDELSRIMLRYVLVEPKLSPGEIDELEFDEFQFLSEQIERLKLFPFGASPKPSEPVSEDISLLEKRSFTPKPQTS